MQNQHIARKLSYCLALTITALGLCALFLGLCASCSASPVTYPFRAIDNFGSLVPGATIAVGSTALTPGAATTVLAGAGEKVLTTAVAPAASVSVTLLDYGTGDYAIIYDPAGGEMYFPLSISKSGSTITGATALVAVVCSADSSNLLNVPLSLFSATFTTIPGSHTSSGAALPLSYKQFLALQDAISGGDNSTTIPVVNGTATVSYYLRGQPKTAANLVAIATVSYTGLNQTSRAVLVSNPFPTVP